MIEWKRPRAPKRRPFSLRCAQTTTPIEDGTPSIKEKVDIALGDDALFEAALVIPPKPKGSVGRGRMYPDYVWTLWPELRDIFGSHTAVERELGRGGWWAYIRRELARLRPSLPPLTAKPPLRQHFEYMRDKYMITDEETRRSLEIHTEVATEQAKEPGNLDPNGGGSCTHPDPIRTLYGDGKVLTPLYRAKPGTRRVDRKTGELREVRSDPDAAFHTEGGGDRVFGTKFALLSTRRPEGRFILAVEPVVKDRDEAKAALEMLRRTKPHVPGAQAVVWDMILRGEHLQTVMSELGLVPVVGVHAKENPKGGKGRKASTFVPKTVDLEDVPVTLPDGTTTVMTIAAHNGWASLKELTETGEPHYRHLRCVRIRRHEDKEGFRFYGYYQLPIEYGGGTISLRHHQNQEDAERGLNRAENLRPIPEGSEDFLRLNRLRRDAESINDHVERSLYINRATAKGLRRQLVDLLGHARLVNAITLARCRGRQRASPAA